MQNKILENFFNIKNLKNGIHRQLTDGISTMIFAGERAMLSIVTVEPNAVGKTHFHPEEQWGFLLEGSLKRFQGGITVSVNEGDFWRTPGGVEHGVIGGPQGAKILDVFAPPRFEYLNNGSGFGKEK